MSTFLHRLTPETLTKIRDELVGQRFLDRDLACVALQVCNDCEFYGTLEHRPLVVFPSDDGRPGWKLLDLPQEEPQEQPPSPPPEEDEPDPEPTAKEESQAPDSADRDSGDLTRPECDADLDPESGHH